MPRGWPEGVLRFVEHEVAVSVPATSANLGPGFDCLGLAVSLRDRLAARILPGGLEVVAGGESTGLPRDERHLVVRTMRAAFDRLGGQPPGLALRADSVIPQGRGLGSSSAAIVAGLGLARALVVDGRDRLDDDAMLQLAARLEGHPDNVAAAIGGGLVISGADDQGFFAVGSPVHPTVSVVVFVPATPVATHTARALLPVSVPHVEAAANAGRAALLIAALAHHPEQLLRGTADLLHQGYREPVMPGSVALVRSLRSDGVPAVISGAGPTVLAFWVADGAVDSADRLLRSSPAGWTAYHLRIERHGLRDIDPAEVTAGSG